MATPTLAQQAAIANLYIALFNRAPDAAGFAFWTQALADGATIDVLARGFVQTPEAQAIYPASQTAAQFVTTYYTNVLGRPIDESGLKFWTEILESSGGVNSNLARALVVSKIVEVVNTPLPVKPAELTDAAYALTFADRNAFKNKVDISIFYATDYKGNDLNLAKQVLSVVGPATTTIDVAKALLNPPSTGGGEVPVTPPVVVPPTTAQNLVGTTGTDNFVGSPQDDTFSFLIDIDHPGNTTFKAGDTVSGNDGTDTLQFTVRGDAAVSNFKAGTVTGIETVSFTAESSAIARYDVEPGVTTLISKNSGLNGVLLANKLASDTNFVLDGGTGSFANLTYLAGVATAAITVTGGVSAATISVTNGPATTTITSKGTENSLGSLVARSATVNIVAETDLSISGLATGATSTVNVTGAGVVSLGVMGSGATIDAHLNSGGLKATLSSSNVGIVVLGSTGNDVISTSSGRLTGSINVGAGDADRLIATATVALDSAAVRGRYTGFEILEVRDRVTVDVDGLVGITSVEIADITGSTGVTNLSAAQAAAVTILSANSTGPVTIGLQNTAGTSDTVKAVVMTSTNNVATPIDLAGLTLAGIEKLELTGNGTVLNNNGLVTLTTANATALNSIIVKNLGGASITVDGAHAAANLNIDASASTGVVTLNASAYAQTGLVLKAGANSSTLTGSGQADTLHAGKTVSTFAQMTGGLGADTFVFSTPDNNNAHGRTTAEITDFQTGVDKIKLAVVAPANSGAYFAESAPSASLSDLLSAADTKLDATVKIYVGQVGGDTYVVADADGNGYTEVIKLAGIDVNQMASTDFIMGPP